MSRSHLPLLLFFSGHEKMEWEREEGGASEREKLVEAIERDERSRRVPWKGPLMNSFPLSRGISLSLSRHPRPSPRSPIIAPLASYPVFSPLEFASFCLVEKEQLFAP